MNTPEAKAGGFKRQLKAGLRGTIPATVEEHGLLPGGDSLIAIGAHAVFPTMAEMKRVRTYI